MADEGKARVTIVGSSNMDLVVKAARIPAVGETILGGDFIMVPGGKGANQAVAAARLGADAFFVGKLGRDLFGAQSVENLEKAGVQTKYVTVTDEAPSGVALIMVDQNGDNSIVVAPGANGRLSSEDVQAAEDDILASGAVVAQLEVPLETVGCAAELAKSAGVPFVLDPAPACELSADLLGMVDVLTPNESEAQILTGMDVTDRDSALAAGQWLLAAGVKAVVITMGAEGSLLVNADGDQFVRARRVEPVDTTAAGDAFTGCLAVGIAEGKSLSEAAVYATCAAALSVTRMGAQPSMPARQEVDAFYNQGG